MRRAKERWIRCGPCAKAGADVNLADPDGSTALLLAIENGHYDTAAMLLRQRR